MSDMQDNSLENEDNLEQGQEHLETRKQDELDGDTVKIPKQDFEKIKKQLKTANAEAKERREALERYKGIDPDELEELLSLRDSKGDKSSSEDEDRIDRRELEKQRKSLEQKYQKELEALKGENQAMQKRLETTLIESAAREAIVSEKGVPDLILGQVTKNAKLFQNDRGGYDVRIVDEDGNVEFNDKGEYMSIADQVSTLKNHDIFGRAFEATVKQGAGIQGQTGNRKPKSSVTKSELKADKKARNAYITKHGLEAYNALSD